MRDDERQQLDEQGYVVLRGFVDDELLKGLRQRIAELFDEEGARAGHEFKQEEHAHRLSNLVDKGEVFRRAVILPGLLDYVRHVLGPEMKLSSLNARSADPHSEDGQPLHVDMGAIRDERGYWVCNTVWMLDAFTTENGPTRMVPGSTKRGPRPRDVMADTLAPHPEEILLTGEAGSIAVMNAHMWPGGTPNPTTPPNPAP